MTPQNVNIIHLASNIYWVTWAGDAIKTSLLKTLLSV